MRTDSCILVLAWGLIAGDCAGAREFDPAARVLYLASPEEAVSALREPLEDVRLVVGGLTLTPTAALDPTCGNCADPAAPVPCTVGLTISGRNVWLAGPEGGVATIRTNAGYGIYFKDCVDCGITGVRITGGERDTSGLATDAAIVVRNSSVTIRSCVIDHNVGDPEIVARTVTGIMGICGREGADITVENCDIVGNSWDAIALYRDARAIIRNNHIDGVERARGAQIGGGRGVAIGVTWNAAALIERNWVRRYWKGIGVFLDADVVACENIVEEMLTWGIAVWDADRGRPRAIIERNVVYDCGACGISVTRQAQYTDDEPPGRLTGNIVVRTGQNPKYDDPDYYCFQCALALHAVPRGFLIRDNTFHDNRTAADSLFNEDVAEEEFWHERRAWVRALRDNEVGVGGRYRFHESAFLTRYPE